MPCSFAAIFALSKYHLCLFSVFVCCLFMPVLFPCGICNKPVANNHRAVQCDICDLWIHIKCNSISPAVYKEMSETDDLKWCCIKCINETIPFSETPTEILELTNQGKNPDFEPVLTSERNHASFATLLNSLQNAEFPDKLVDDSVDPNPNLVVNKCLYYTVSELNKVKLKENSMNFFHQNIASLSLHFSELSTILSNADIEFDFIGITETGFRTKSCSHDLIGYRHFDCLTESTKGGTRLYFSDRFNYRRRNDLCIYKSKKLESTFVEILSENKEKNLVVGCIYKHPDMDVSDFNEDLYKLLEKLSLEKKKVVLMGDFNIDLLKLDLHDESSAFFEIISSFGLLPTILRPSRITCRSKTLIDNIFSNFSDADENLELFFFKTLQIIYK